LVDHIASEKRKKPTVYTDCQPFIYYSDPSTGPAHIKGPSAEQYFQKKL